MKFTYVIPLYNKAPYILCTLESVLAQTVTDFEVLVIDDGSRDGGAELVEKFPDARVCLIRQANAGVSAARNHGISLARGEWVVFLDADDWHHPRFLETLLVAQEECPQANLVAADYLRLLHREVDWPPRWPVPEGRPRIECIANLASRWMDGPTLCASSVAARTSTLMNMQPCFPQGESMGEDLDLWFRLAETGDVALARIPLAAYRIAVEGSLTSFHGKRERPAFLERLRQRARSGNMSDERARSTLQLVAQHEITFARESLATGERLLGLTWVARSVYAANTTRWWITAAMALFMPSQLVNKWQAWRIRRARHDVALTDAEQAL
ncbi:MAG: glycosyltransferase family A protein [Pseudomonadota bacterium]